MLVRGGGTEESIQDVWAPNQIPEARQSKLTISKEKEECG